MADHSNTIAAFLLVEFFVFVTSRGRLAKYKGFLIG